MCATIIIFIGGLIIGEMTGELNKLSPEELEYLEPRGLDFNYLIITILLLGTAIFLIDIFKTPVPIT